MNDGLAEAIAQAILAADDNPAWELGILGHKELGQVAALAVRAWLALPPSEEETAATAVAICVGKVHGRATTKVERGACENCKSLARSALVASRAVLVRPPAVEKGTS